LKAARVIWAGGLAISASDTPVVIDDDDAIFFLPGRLDRTDIDAGRILALKTLDRQVVLVGLRHGLVELRITVLELRRSFRHFEDADVGLLGCSVVIVLAMTCLGTLPVAIAETQVDRITVADSRQRAVILDVNLGSVLLASFLFQSSEYRFFSSSESSL
jgi:hypothetical protein